MKKKTTVLIVDDEPEVLATVADQVRSFGYDVIERADAESALSVLRDEKRVGLVITDMRLPGMNGVDLLAEIRRARLAVPVIVLTGHTSVETFIETQSQGAYEYVNKPVRSAELRRIIQMAMARAADVPSLGS